MEQAAFKISNYKFPKTLIDYSNSSDTDIDVSFTVAGKYKNSESRFFLEFTTHAKFEDKSDFFIKIDCEASFEFKNVNSISEIPDFFYTNAIAILFPYVRAYISTVTVQSNIKPIILPTLNLMSLSKELRESTNEID